jgi:hypothetical protein
MYALPILNLGQGEVYNIINDKVNQWLATGWWFSQGIPVSSTNKTDSHDITEILYKNNFILCRFLEDKASISWWVLQQPLTRC